MLCAERSGRGPGGAEPRKHPGGGPRPPAGALPTRRGVPKGRAGAQLGGGGKDAAHARRGGQRPPKPGAKRRGPQAPGAHSQRAHTAENGRGPLNVTGTPPNVTVWPSCEVWSQRGGRYR